MALGCICALVLSYPRNHVVMLSSTLFSAVLALVPCCARFLNLLSEPGSRSLESLGSLRRFLEIYRDIITPAQTPDIILISKNIYSPPKLQLHFHPHCQCSSFQNTCHFSTWNMSVSIVTDCNQNSSNRRRTQFSIHAPMENGCVVCHGHRSFFEIESNIVISSLFVVFYPCLQPKVCSVKCEGLFFSIEFLESLQTRLQAINFTIRTSSTNTNFALCPRFCSHEICLCCNFFLFRANSGCIKTAPTQDSIQTCNATMAPSTSLTASQNSTRSSREGLKSGRWGALFPAELEQRKKGSAWLSTKPYVP